jgi:hypothetical protein
MAMEIDSETKPGTQVRVQFSTRDPVLNLPQTAPILIPTGMLYKRRKSEDQD